MASGDIPLSLRCLNIGGAYSENSLFQRISKADPVESRQNHRVILHNWLYRRATGKTTCRVNFI